METPDVKDLKPKEMLSKPEKTAYTILGSLERGIGAGIGGAVNRTVNAAIGADESMPKKVGVALGQLAVGAALASAVKKNCHAANLASGFADAPIAMLGWQIGQKLGLKAKELQSQVSGGNSQNDPSDNYDGTDSGGGGFD